MKKPLIVLLLLLGNFGVILPVSAQTPPDPYIESQGYQFGRVYMEDFPNEHVDPFSGSLMLTYTDVDLPGPGGFNLRLQRTFNSNFRYHATTGTVWYRDINPAGLGWIMHMGVLKVWDDKLVGSPLTGATYEIEMPDGSLHPLIRSGSTVFTTRERWRIEYKPNNPGIEDDSYELYLRDGTHYRFDWEMRYGYPMYYWSFFCTRISGPVNNGTDTDYNQRIDIRYNQHCFNTVTNMGTTCVNGLNRAIQNTPYIHQIKQYLVYPSTYRTIDFYYGRYTVGGHNFYRKEGSGPPGFDPEYCFGPSYLSCEVLGYDNCAFDRNKIIDYIKVTTVDDSSPLLLYTIDYEYNTSTLVTEDLWGGGLYGIRFYLLLPNVYIKDSDGTTLQQWQYNYETGTGDLRYRYDLTRVTYPLGGTIEYEYGEEDYGSGNHHVVTEKMISNYDYSPPARTWTYDYYYGGASGENRVEVTSPCAKRVYRHFPEDASAPYKSGLLKQLEFQNTGGTTTYKKVETDWSYFNLGSPSIRVARISQQKNTWGSSTFTSDYHYPSLNTELPDSVTEEAGITEGRTVNWTYLNQNGTCSSYYHYNAGALDTERVTGPSLTSGYTTQDLQYDGGSGVCKGLVTQSKINGVVNNYTYYGNGALKSIDENGGYTVFSDPASTWGTPNKISYGGSTSSDLTGLYVIDFQSINEWGLPLSKRFAADSGTIYSYEYDDLGRVTDVNPPGTGGGAEASTTISYATSGNGRITTIEKGDVTLELRYDGFGRLQSRERDGSDTLAIESKVQLDACGQITKEYRTNYTAALTTNYLTFTYDGLGRMLNKTYTDNDPSGLSDFDAIQTTYSYSNNVVTETIERNYTGHSDIVNKYTYGGFGDLDLNLLMEVILDDNGESARTVYTQDALGNLRNVKRYDGLSLTEEHIYGYSLANGLLRVTSESHPQWQDPITYEYQANTGLLYRKNIPKRDSSDDFTLTYSYDEAGRIEEVACDDPSENGDFQYEYVSGLPYLYWVRRVEGSDIHFQYTYSYYDNGLPETKTIQIGAFTYANPIRYSFDPHNYLTQIDYPTGNYVNYSVDDLGRVTSALYHDAVKGDLQVVQTGTTYTAWNGLDLLKFGNGVITDYGYNEDRMLIDELRTYKDSVNITHYKYTDFTNPGDIVEIDNVLNDDRDISLKYDGLRRLTSATSSMWEDALAHDDVLFTYDDLGNRLTNEFQNVTSTYYYDADNRLDYIKRGAPYYRRFTYDNRGNVVDVQDRDYNHLRRFTYNGDNQIIESLNNQTGALDLSYIYDNNLNRIYIKDLRPEPDKERIFIYDEGGRLLSEMIVNGTVQGQRGTDYIYVGGRLVAKIQSE